MRMTTPKHHIIMHKPYELKDYGSSPVGISGSWSSVYMSKPQMGSGKANKYGFINSGYNQYSRPLTGQLKYPFTWCAWLKKFADTDTSYPIFMSYGLPYMACNGAGQPWRLSYTNQAGSQVNLLGTTIPVLDQWYHVCATDDGTTIKLYVNGVLEDSSTDNMTSAGSNATDGFDMGRHYNTNTYRIHGAIDDVRVYDVALDAAEIAALANLERDERVMEITNSGDVIINQNYVDEPYDWYIESSFNSNLSGNAYAWYEDSWPWRLDPVNGGSINTTAKLTADGWTQYLTTINTSSYTRYRGYMQFFYSGSPIGYIYKNFGNGWERIRVRWGNWYTGTSYLDLGTNNGSWVNKQTLGSSAGGRDYETNLGTQNSIRFRESGIIWPGEVWLGNAKTYEGGFKGDKADFKFVQNTGISYPRLLSDGFTFEYPGKLIVR